VKTSSRLPKPVSCQTHQHKTDRLIPDSRQTQTPSDPTIGATIASFTFLHTSHHRQTLISVFFRIARTANSYSQAWRKSDIIFGLEFCLSWNLFSGNPVQFRMFQQWVDVFVSWQAPSASQKTYSRILWQSLTLHFSYRVYLWVSCDFHNKQLLFRKQCEAIYFCIRDALCFLWDKNWLFKYYVDELRASSSCTTMCYCFCSVLWITFLV
jgi:hypothetical protein